MSTIDAGGPATTSDREIAVSRAFEAPRGLIWEAWTSPEHLPRWMLGPSGWTMPVCEVDLRPGGALHFAWSSHDGGEMAMRGVYQELDPPARLVFAESWGGPWPDTLKTVNLAEQDGGGTTMTLTIVYPTAEARDAVLGAGMLKGMAASLDRLEDYLRTMA